MFVGNIDDILVKAESILGYTFESKDILLKALTHPSAVEDKCILDSYERLEFLGDSILGALVATELYKMYPEMDEGNLTRMKVSLVSGSILSKVAAELGLDELIIFGPSECGTGKRGMTSALEDVYEALTGALYLEAGYEATHEFVVRTLSPHISEKLAYNPISPKSKLQEVTQRDFSVAPTYELIKTSGAAHAPHFTSAVYVNGKEVGLGEGTTKKASESEAARDALEKMGYLDY